jgi:TolB-like protein/tetratricopeptide (TPR) repeat protein
MSRFPSYKGDGPYIFTSYSHEDDEQVDEELAWLSDAGYNFWHDGGIVGGEEWTERLAKSIDGASIFMFFASERSIASRHCRDEIHLAKEREKPILVVYLEKTDLKYGLELSLALTQAIDKQGLTEQSYRETLLAAIEQSFNRDNVPADSRSGQDTTIKKADESIAVLPFVNTSSDPENEYFSDGISEEILNALVKTNHLPVIARASSFAFKNKELKVQEISRQLGVTHLLEGSVRKSGDRVRINAYLVDGLDGKNIWSDQFDRVLTDVFAIQDEIALTIVSKLEDTLKRVPSESVDSVASSDRSTTDMEAYELYLRAATLQAEMNPKSLRDAQTLYEQVLDQDPTFVDAWTGLAWSFFWQAHPWIAAEMPRVAYTKAKNSAEKVIALEPDNAQAIFIIGVWTALVENQWADGFRMMEQALTINPQNAEMTALYGIYLFWCQQPRASLFMERALRLDPLSPIVATTTAIIAMFTGRQMDALKIMEPLLENQIDNYLSYIGAAAFYFTLQKFDDGERLLERARTFVDDRHPSILAYKQQAALGRGNQELAANIGSELLERSETEYIPYLGRTLWVEDQVVLIFNRIIEQGQLYFIVSSLLQPKPSQFSDNEWKTLIGNVNLSELIETRERGAGRLRSPKERKIVSEEKISLDSQQLNDFRGTYEALYHGRLFISVKDGHLHLSHSIYDVEGELIPVADTRFKLMNLNIECEFRFTDDSLSCLYHDGQSDVEYLQVDDQVER